MFSERKILEHPEVKIATRDMFDDEQGKHRRTKKQILDEQGNIRAGCSIILKGEVYESYIFTQKDEWFKNKALLYQSERRCARISLKMVAGSL